MKIDLDFVILLKLLLGITFLALIFYNEEQLRKKASDVLVLTFLVFLILFWALLCLIGLIIYPFVWVVRKIKKIEKDDLIQIYFIILALIWVVGVYITIPLHGRLKEIKTALIKFFNGTERIVEGYTISSEEVFEDLPYFDDNNSSNSGLPRTIKVISFIVKIMDQTLGEEISVVFDKDSYLKFNPKAGLNVRYSCSQGGFFGGNKIFFEYVIYQV
jgi:hypothetical protein